MGTGKNAAGKQLPCACERRIERPVLVAKEANETDTKGYRCENAEPWRSPDRSRDEQQGWRPEDVELFLDTQGPEMQQRVLCDVRCEVAGLADLEQSCGKGDTGVN